MKLLLSHLWHAGGAREFDTESGKIKRIRGLERDDTEFGSIWKQNGKWFAFYRDDISLLLQCGREKWRVTPDSAASVKGSFLRHFRISRDNRVIFSMRYKPKGVLFWLVDPTYDAIDAESDDFFLYVSNMWSYWASRPITDFEI